MRANLAGCVAGQGHSENPGLYLTMYFVVRKFGGLMSGEGPYIFEEKELCLPIHTSLACFGLCMSKS